VFAQQYNRDALRPDIQVTRFERDGDRSLTVRHRVHRNRPLSEDFAEVAKHLARLWGFCIRFETAEESDRLRHVQEFRPA